MQLPAHLTEVQEKGHIHTRSESTSYQLYSQITQCGNVHGVRLPVLLLIFTDIMQSLAVLLKTADLTSYANHANHTKEHPLNLINLHLRASCSFACNH
jgi:hypothetical protein